MLDEVPHDRLGAARRTGASPFHHCGQSWSPTRCSCRHSARSCWATMCRGSGGGDDRLDPAPAPQRAAARPPAAAPSLVEGEEQAVAAGAGPPAGAAEPLQERRRRVRGRVDLDDPVEVADVDAELQGAGGDDDAVARLGERLLGAAALVGGQRGVGQEGRHARAPAAAAPSSSTGCRDSQKTSRFSPAVQRGDDRGGVVDRADVVELDVAGRRRRRSRLAGRRRRARRPAPAVCPRPTPAARSAARRGCRRWPTGRCAGAAGRRRGSGVPARRAGASPGRRRRRRAPRRRRRPAGRRRTRRWSTLALTSIDSSDSGVVSRMSGRSRRIARRCGSVDVAVPERGAAAEPAGVRLEPGQQVVEQRLERADVEHRQCPASRSLGHPATAAGRSPPRSCRRRSGASSRASSPASSGAIAASCSGRRPASQRVDDVVQDDRVQQVDGAHGQRHSSSVDRRRRGGGVALDVGQLGGRQGQRVVLRAGRSRRTGRPGRARRRRAS